MIFTTQKAVSGDGKEIAGHVVEQAVLMLHPLDVVQSQVDAPEDRPVVIEFRLRVAVGRDHGGDPVDGILGLIDAVRLGKRAVPGLLSIRFWISRERSTLFSVSRRIRL